MMRYTLIHVILLLFTVRVMAQDSNHVHACRVKIPPKIDGVLNEEVWQAASPATLFVQSDPDYKAASTQKTEVKVLYDDNAIYIGAMLYDTHPDSIKHELGARDDEGLNSDYFTVALDTYNKLIDAYHFEVSAGGIQLDFKIQDPTFDAVWTSKVTLNKEGWCAEMRIPYSAIRFPAADTSQWRISFHRIIRRRRELSHWPFIPKDDPKVIKYFGYLDDLHHIKAPLRLSLIPYLSVYAERSPDYHSDGSYSYSNALSYGAGADIKYGLNEKFTLDMTLLPDFSQVQSDNKVKNLSYREITYQENRPFFKESVELFSKNMLFYSRRIGRTPTLHDSIPLHLKPGETLDDNPSQTRLLNCIKLSGRTNKGLGIGIFNAVTDNAYASIHDSTGRHRTVMTEPFANYNILVLDQQLKNSSSVYLINTSVLRDHSWANSDVSGAGFELLNKKNSARIVGDLAYSQRFNGDSTGEAAYDRTGYKYNIGLEKVGGRLTYGIRHNGISNTFNQLDMGYYIVPNMCNTFTFITYDQFVAGKRFRNAEISVDNNFSTNFMNGNRTQNQTDVNAYCMLLNYLVFFGGANISPQHNLDYFEPRVAGKVYQTRRFVAGYTGVSTDYRHPFALDLKLIGAQYVNEDIGGAFIQAELGLRYRINDRISVTYNATLSRDNYNEGFAALDSAGNPVIGGRLLNTVVNGLKMKYIFSPTMALTLNARHYWNTGTYLHYFNLNTDGTLREYPQYHQVNDFSYNAFNIDLVYTWIFSPGSSLSLIYKNAIETNVLGSFTPSYTYDFNNTMLSPQINSISLKLLYYLDYQELKSIVHRKKE
ncbi:MAG: DUF5916 domain-containing protein [Bacteroidia bacterium]